MAISRLIVPPSITDKSYNIKLVSIYAKAFVDNMTNVDRKHYKNMLEHGIEAGHSAADAYGVPFNIFIEEVKKII